ncbi:hypothetical protein HanIR_Chr15g0755911 [Helianthus annuus]|nr:hypothetical protein HanIR_Chr15g0755911 [Helianthus annuus]
MNLYPAGIEEERHLVWLEHPHWLCGGQLDVPASLPCICLHSAGISSCDCSLVSYGGFSFFEPNLQHLVKPTGVFIQVHETFQALQLKIQVLV